MAVRTGLILSALVAGGVVMLAPARASAQQEPKDNMWTRSATLYLSQARTNPSPEEKRQRFEEALKVSREGIEKEPDNPQGYFQAGQALIGLGNFVAADSMLTHAEELWPDYKAEIDQHREYAWVQAYNAAIPALNAGNTQEAEQQFMRAHAIYRGRPEAMLNLGQIAATAGDADAAIAHYQTALEILRGPEAAAQDSTTQHNWLQNEQIATFNLAQLLAQEGRNEEAAAEYQGFLDRNPDNIQAMTNLAIVLTNMEMADSASAIYDNLLNRDDLSARDYFNAGIGLFQAEQYDRASDAFEKVVAIAPDSRDATYNLAQTLYLVEDYDQLASVSEKLVELDPANTNAHTFYVRALLNTGQEEAAQEAYDHMQAMPVEVHSLQLSPRGSGGGSLYGQVENKRTEEGATLGLRIHFIGSTGAEVGATDVEVQMPGLETSVPFQADLESDQELIAYWYELTTELPLVEVPEEEADTTGVNR